MNPLITRHSPRPASQLREARRRLNDDGQAPAELLGPALARSWQRSLQAGLPTHGRNAGGPHASAAQLARALERQYELLSHARPVIAYMAEHVRDSGSVVILADAQGMLLHTLGDDAFAGRAERVALRPGAHWTEAVRGTNAIGTALAEQAPVVIHGAEHYLERNGFLTCAAAPIVDPAGRLLGVIDISGDQRGWHPSSLGHTLGLACAAARMVEHRLFDTWHAAGLRLRFHAQAEGIATLSEGLLALAEDGTVIGANSNALAALGISRDLLGQTRIDGLLGLGMDTLMHWARQGGHAPHALVRPNGQTLWLRLEAGRRALVNMPLRPGAGNPGEAGGHGGPSATAADGSPGHRASPSAAGIQDALAALDLGDAAVRAAIGRARRVVDKPIALLLQGESGVGKEVFARALHASGPRRAAPFVAVNCAALPDTLIEAELFGYQPGAFTGARREGAPGRVREAQGGTLFLDEIGDMPLAMQARLLRVLQDRAVVPLGGGKPVAVDFALVCATHRHLRQAINEGTFREDLYYRLNGLSLQLPALRERTDQPALINRLLAEAAPGRELQLSPDLAAAFARHAWPGNLRQLANALRTACALLGDDEAVIDWPHLPDDLAQDLAQHQAQHQTLAQHQAGAAAQTRQRAQPEPDANLRLQEEATVRRVLDTCGGNLSEAARRLGISRNTLYRKLGR